MTPHSRNKGRTAEREVELILQAAGLHTDRNLGGRTQVSGDIAARVPASALAIRLMSLSHAFHALDSALAAGDEEGTNLHMAELANSGLNDPRPFIPHRPSLAIEVRRRETLSLSAWSAEHEKSTPPHQLPAVVYRRSREPWRISLRLEDFLSLIHWPAHGELREIDSGEWPK